MSIFLYEKSFVSLSTSWVLKSLVVAVALSTSAVTTDRAPVQTLKHSVHAVVVYSQQGSDLN
jgi:cobalt-zinc-cadmium efflux system outer membrane protein